MHISLVNTVSWRALLVSLRTLWVDFRVGVRESLEHWDYVLEYDPQKNTCNNSHNKWILLPHLYITRLISKHSKVVDSCRTLHNKKHLRISIQDTYFKERIPKEQELVQFLECMLDDLWGHNHFPAERVRSGTRLQSYRTSQCNLWYLPSNTASLNSWLQ